MKIGVVSDTHIPIKCCELPQELLKGLRGCELLIHAGDLVDESVLKELQKIAKVEAVQGNMDQQKLKSMLPEKKILEICGKKIAVMHGYGPPDKLVELLKNEFIPQNPDIIIFGHSHVPMNDYVGNTLFFNPGSATDTVFAPYRSYGIIEIDKDKISARICKL